VLGSEFNPITGQSFGALPGQPGSPTFDPNAALQSPGNAQSAVSLVADAPRKNLSRRIRLRAVQPRRVWQVASWQRIFCYSSSQLIDAVLKTAQQNQ
jgi:hypothetical protein